MMQNSRASQKDTGKTGGSLLRSKTPKFLAVLIIFFASTQLGYHFWPLSSLVYGIRIDYLSPTLYFLDILILVYLGLVTKGFDPLRRSWPMAKMFSRAITNRETGSNPQSIILSLLPILLTNLLFSQNPLSTLNWSLHLLLYFSFLVALGSDLKGRAQPADSKAGRSDPKVVISFALTLALLFQLVLGISQFYVGHSVGGLLYYFGERTVAVGAPGIATTSFMGEVVLRAYGTFSHPNILAGWAVITLLILLRLSPGSDLLRKSWPKAKMFSRLQNIIGRPGQTLWVLIVSAIIFLTNSRSAALALFGVIIPFHLIQKTKSRFVYFSIFICSLFFVLRSSPLPRTDLSTHERLSLQAVSLQVIAHFPIFGTGAQSSTSTYPMISSSTRLLQPDHNSFTLFLSWFGVFGVLAILYCLRSQFENLRIIIPLLPLLLLDHYFLTSPQGVFIFLFYVLIALNYSHAQKNRQ